MTFGASLRAVGFQSIQCCNNVLVNNRWSQQEGVCRLLYSALLSKMAKYPTLLCILSSRKIFIIYFVHLKFQKYFLFFGVIFEAVSVKKKKQSQWNIREYKQHRYVVFKYAVLLVLSVWTLHLSVKQLPGVWRWL